MSIPIVDFATSTDPAGQVHSSLADLGFMQVRNYGIDEDLLAQVFAASRAFFNGDKATKERCLYRSAAENFGYQGIQQENLDPTAPADLKETFTMRNILNDCPGDDRWPDAGFKTLMQAFYENALQSSFVIMRAIAKPLQVAEDFFEQCHSGENISLRILYYPAHAQQTQQAGQLGAGAHTDYGFFTQLFQDRVSGLQVLDKQDTWLDVEPLANTTVINCGDLLERWTNGVYRSTLHRVQIRTPTEDRLSIAFFLDPDSATWIEPLPSCTRGVPVVHSATSAGQHIQEKLEASHKARFAK